MSIDSGKCPQWANYLPWRTTALQALMKVYQFTYQEKKLARFKSRYHTSVHSCLWFFQNSFTSVIPLLSIYISLEKIRLDVITPFFPQGNWDRGKMEYKSYNVLVWVFPEEDPWTRTLVHEIVYLGDGLRKPQLAKPKEKKERQPINWIIHHCIELKFNLLGNSECPYNTCTSKLSHLRDKGLEYLYTSPCQ